MFANPDSKWDSNQDHPEVTRRAAQYSDYYSSYFDSKTDV